MAHDTFTLSPRLAPAPSLLPLAQEMVPHLPYCSARYRNAQQHTQAGPTRAMCPSQKSRCTHAALMDEHKGPRTPRNTLVHPQPPGMPSRMKFLSEQEECADRRTQPACRHHRESPHPAPGPQHRLSQAQLSCSPRQTCATCVHHTHKVLEVLQPRLLTQSQTDTPDLCN